MIDNRTTSLNLPLPHADNILEDDVGRLRESLTTLDAAVAAREIASNKGAVGGYASLDGSGKVPSAQLPAFVDDVLEFANVAAFPATGTSGIIYVALNAGTSADPSKAYRWSGSAYTEISPSPGSTDDVPEGATNKYFTDLRARAAQNPATSVAVGVIKVGSGLTVGGDGTLSVSGSTGGGTGLPAFGEIVIVPTTNGQTLFTPVGGYIPGQIELYLNGHLLFGNGDDYTASDGVNITLAVGANTTDTMLLRHWYYLPAENAVNKTGDSMSGALNEAAAVTLASGATLDVGTANTNTINVSGAATVGSLGTSAVGVKRRLVSSGTPKYTHNAVSLIIPGELDFQTSTGDVLEFLSLGGGNWRCVGYVKANGFPLDAGFLSSKAASGYQKLPSGLILQWGTGTTSGGGGGSVVFPIAFPNACLFASAVCTGSGNTTINTSSKYATGLTVTMYNGATGAGQADSFAYFSLGW